LGRVKGLVFLLVSDGALNGVGVDDLSDIGVGKDGSVEMVSSLASGSVSVATEEFIKGLEGRFSPDDESSEVTTGSELLKVKSVDVGDFNTGKVSNSSEEGDVFVAVNKEGTSSESVSLVSHLTLTSSDGLGVGNSFNIFEAPTLFKKATASLVFSIPSILSSTTKGSMGMFWIL